MNDAATTQTKEIIYRRLTEPVELFGHELPSELWLVILGLILLAGFFYIGWMYLRDSRSVGPWWASLMGLLRASVYVLLAWVFLLRAEQTWEETQLNSKVLVLFDTSASTSVIDDVPSGRSGEKLRSRQDKVLEFLTSKPFTDGLTANNPVTVYRFARRLDEDYLLLRDGRAWTRAEWEDPQRDAELAPGQAPPDQPLTEELWTAFLKPGVKVTAPGDWAAEQKDRLAKALGHNQKLGEVAFFNGTNLGGSVLNLVNRERNNRVQAIVIFTDGRSTEGSSQSFRDITEQAKNAHIPLFVVGVGEERPQVKVEIADMRVPDLVQPEDRFRAVVEVTGEGLADQKADVQLEITHVRKGAGGKEENVDVSLIEAEDKPDATQRRMEVSLGKRVVLKPESMPVFDRSTPPRVSVEFPIDPHTLAAAVNVDLNAGELAGKKWQLSETKEGELRFVARVPRDKLEVFAGKFHQSEPSVLRVIKKPLRVLLFASAPTRDYQFLRTLLVREMDKKRAELSIYLQPPPGHAEQRTGIVQDVDPERLLTHCPNHLEATSRDERLYALDEYDVIVAFDPDWSQLSDQVLKNVETWVDKGGGLIAIGGPINTLQLARPGPYKEKLRPILDLYPVTLRDVRIDELDRTTTDPWPLSFEGATPEMEFLKLEESDKDTTKFLGDWDAFFYGPRKEGEPKGAPLRGFYNYYPVEFAKSGALVVARFTDPRAKLKDGSQQPYLVLSDPASHRRVVWIGSGETWRLRQYREAFHERFWTKLLRYAAAGNLTKVNKHVRLEMAPSYVSNRFVEVEAQAYARGGEPLESKAKPPEITLTMPQGVSEKEVAQPILMRPKPTGNGWFSARFQVRSPGNYTLNLKVPDTGDTQSRRFSVREANPEMDNTRPDFEQMYRLASEADEVLERMGESERQALKEQLRRGRPVEVDKPEASLDKPRLFFNLHNAHLIPTCMRKDVAVQRSRGPIKDQWDDGWLLSPRDPPQQPVKLSYVLVAVVGLLSMEWLVRKLLRLA